MYTQNLPTRTLISVNKSYVGETLEAKIRRIENNREPISDGAPLIYTDRKDGIKPEYDIRTDRFEIAVDAMDKVTKSALAKRDSLGEIAKKNMEIEAKTDGGAEPLQATETK